MKKRIQDSQKRALLQAKEQRFGKAMDVAIEARKKAKRKTATREDKVNFSIKNLRAIERTVEMLDARIKRVEEILIKARKEGKKQTVVKLKGDIAKASNEKTKWEREIKKARKAIDAELKNY
jgi:hypothetical protein